MPWRLTPRGVVRLAGVAGVALFGLAGYLLRPEDRRTLAGRAAWLQRCCARSLRVLGVKVEADGLPSGGAMLAPNHVSYLDILVLASLRPAVFVAKAEVAGWPVFGWFAARAGTRFLRRERKADVVRVGSALQPVIDAGVGLVVFLEGTSTDGRGVRVFRSSLLEPAVAQRWTVVPVAIRYEVPAPYDAAVDVAWWGTMPLAPHLTKLAGVPTVRATVRVGTGWVAQPDRKAVAERLQREVAELLAARQSRS